MIRSNVGNIATNAIQTMAISGTTAAGMKRASDLQKQYEADKRLNNSLSGRSYFEQHPEDAELVGQSAARERVFAAKQSLGYTDEEKQKLADAQKKRNLESARQAETGLGISGINLSNEQQKTISQGRDIAMYEKYADNDVDDLLADTPQKQELGQNIVNNIIDNLNRLGAMVHGDKGQWRPVTKEDLTKDAEKEDK